MPNVNLRIKDINDKRLYTTKKYKFSNDYFVINIPLEKDFIFTKPINKNNKK